MRKVNSAPANLCLMKNNKLLNNKNSNNYNNIIPFVTNKFSKHSFININQNKDEKKEINYKNNNNEIKKKILTKVNEVTNDIIQNSNFLDTEELNIISIIVNYIFESNINKKTIYDLKDYFISYFIRYLVMILFHSYILHDFNEKYVHVLDVINKISLP